jgi:cobalt-zinc-cadmium efflux system membrane fusion protein
MTHESSTEYLYPSHTSRRWWSAAPLVFVLTIGAGVWGCSRSTEQPKAATQEKADTERAKDSAPVTLDVEPEIQRAAGLADQAVERRAVAETIQTTGVVGPDETRLARIRPLAEGRVSRVLVRAGDRVTTDQSLLLYDSITAGDLISQYQAALATSARTQAEADVARRSLERADNLVEIGAVAKGERDRRAAEHQRALAEVNATKAAVTNLEQKLLRLGVSREELGRAGRGDAMTTSRSAVSAPFAGVITEVHSAPGEVIAPDRELFVLADLSQVWIQSDVYQKDVANVRVGQEAAIAINSYPGSTFTGRVTYVSNVLDPTTRTAKVRVEVPNRDGRLKIQMYASVALPVGATHEALLVPARAIQEIDAVPSVFVRVDEDKFQLRPVRTGAAIGDLVEVLEGLKADERVVTDGALMLKSRLKLRVESEEGEKK